MIPRSQSTRFRRFLGCAPCWRTCEETRDRRKPATMMQNQEQLNARTEPLEHSRSPLVLAFHDINATLLAQVGGKAANLGEMTHAGLPVPPGFCITTEAYQQVAERADLNELLDRLASKEGQTHSGEITAAIRERLLQVPFPQELADTVRGAYSSLGKGSPLAVAVRSSATAEDLPFASFAGQQDTYLNIVGEDA